MLKSNVDFDYLTRLFEAGCEIAKTIPDQQSDFHCHDALVAISHDKSVEYRLIFVNASPDDVKSQVEICKQLQARGFTATVNFEW